jgi:hypothetical protein
MSVDSPRRVDLHAFVELGVQVGSRLCTYGSAGRQPRGTVWLRIIATSAPDRPIATSHCWRSWRAVQAIQASSLSKDRSVVAVEGQGMRWWHISSQEFLTRGIYNIHIISKSQKTDNGARKRDCLGARERLLADIWGWFTATSLSLRPVCQKSNQGIPNIHEYSWLAWIEYNYRNA